MLRTSALRRGIATGAAVLAAVTVGLTVAAPAGATVVTPANSIIIGSGGQTPYSPLSSLAQLFNGSQGCNESVPSGQTQPYNFSCPSGGSLPAGNFPTGYGLPSVGSPYSENPLNDVAAVEQGISSSAGITQLENQGTHTTATGPVSFASSARAAEVGANGKYDDQGLNFVAYAADGVDYVVYKDVNSVSTAPGTVKSLTQAQLQAIWTGQDKCWSDVGAVGKYANSLIDPYETYTSSAITSTWDSYLYPDNSENYVNSLTSWPPSPLPTCKNGKQAIYSGPTFTNYAATHTVLQNQLSSIQANGDGADAITIFSVGRYNQEKKLPSLKDSVLGAIGSPAVSPTETTILNGSYPVPQYLYTVYSDGTNSDIPVSNPATLNFASEDGFLCKVNTTDGTPTGTQIADPRTGATYRSEIEAAITAAGFYPLDGLDPNVPFDEGSVTTPASDISTFTSSSYYQYDTPPTATDGDPLGYCQVTTTDGNTGHD